MPQIEKCNKLNHINDIPSNRGDVMYPTIGVMHLSVSQDHYEHFKNYTVQKKSNPLCTFFNWGK